MLIELRQAPFFCTRITTCCCSRSQAIFGYAGYALCGLCALTIIMVIVKRKDIQARLAALTIQFALVTRSS